MALKELAPLLEEFPVIEANEFNIEKYEWTKPDCWLWDWPKSLGWIPPSDTPCDLCDKENCNCIIAHLLKNEPQITSEAEKGQGVRAMGMTYCKGQLLGELVGEFAPLDTYNDGWPMEFARPDLDDIPTGRFIRER